MSVLPPAVALTEIAQYSLPVRLSERANSKGGFTNGRGTTAEPKHEVPTGFELGLWKTLVIFGIPRPNRWTKGLMLSALQQ